jgi:hypothetical protein
MFVNLVFVFSSVVSNNDVHMGNSSCCCRSRGALVNEGSVLDRVISQASDHDDCLLYRYCLSLRVDQYVSTYLSVSFLERTCFIYE